MAGTAERDGDAVPACEVLACPTRRTVLLAAAGLAGALAGCGDGGSPAGPAVARSTEPEPAASTAAPGVLIPVAQVPVGGGAVAEGGLVLVVQPTPGVFKAFDARCPHNGVPVGPPDSTGVIVCSGHQARFRAADGSLLGGPAPRALTGIPVKIQDSFVVRA